MHIDMHYYGTYAMARAAGIEPEAARDIATSAQFVDDNKAFTHLEFRDGSRIDQEATAHHLVDCSNFSPRDQRRVWVPFHFFPGNIGNTYTERLKCRMDSPVVRELRDHHLKLSNHPFSLQLLGITAHVYADTFSHFGFSGVSSRGNKVDNSSFLFHEDVEDESSEKLLPDMRTYIMEKKEGFFNSYKIEFPNINSWLGEKAYGTLGHGAVATFPDRPYLVWSFKYERPDAGIDGIRSIRNNPETFLMSCRALHSMFKRFVDARSIHDNGDYVDFDEIESKIQEVLLTQANKVGRVEAWQRAAQAGQIFESGGESIPEYDGEAWNDRWDKLDKGSDYTRAEKTPMWRFYQAASIHRTYVLRDLLPKHGLIVN